MRCRNQLLRRIGQHSSLCYFTPVQTSVKESKQVARVSQRDRATPLLFTSFAPLASIARCRAFSKITGRRAVPLRHMSYLLVWIPFFTIFHFFSLLFARFQLLFRVTFILRCIKCATYIRLNKQCNNTRATHLTVVTFSSESACLFSDITLFSSVRPPRLKMSWAAQCPSTSTVAIVIITPPVS